MPLLILAAFIGMSALMAAGWVFQRAQDNGGWTDVCWSFAMGLTGAIAALAPASSAPNGGVGARQALVAGLVAVWALRLGLHIRARVLSTPEDARYAQFRAEWGLRYPAMMFGFLQIQALAGAVLLVSVIAAAHNPMRSPASGLGLSDLIGAAVLAIAIIGEGVADAQLRAFTRDPTHRNAVCNVGLWAWSRHPNYFFEWFGWLAYPFIALDLSGPYPWGWLSVVAPAAMYVVLRYGSGVPPLEAHMLRSRGDLFRAYQSRVSVFFPLPPRVENLSPRSRPS